MKLIFSVLFFAVVLAMQAAAQTAPYDSARVIRDAQRYARSFRLKNRDLKKFNQSYFPEASDYFKPTAKHVPDAAMLKDSLYVKTYRNVAFYNAVNQRPVIPPLQNFVFPAHTINGTSRPEYTNATEQLARRDAKKFSFSIAGLKRFKAMHYSNTSDYFKPTAQTASDTVLLKDSDYVKTFRNEAFYNSLKRRVDPTGHAIVVVSIVVVATTMLALFLLAVSRASFY
jgi:multisubunit Na+/H+ antiporter MnhC subunit